MAYTLDRQCVIDFQGITVRGENQFLVMKVEGGTISETYCGKKGASYSEFYNQLPEHESRYAIYNYEFESGQKRMLLFITWSPDTAPMRMRRDIANARQIVQSQLSGWQLEIQGSTKDEVTESEILRRINK